MSLGVRPPASPHADRLIREVQTLRRPGEFIFAEDPAIIAPDARIIWSSTLDPGILRVRAVPADIADPEAMDLTELTRWLTSAIDRTGREHAVLSDGLRRIRLDLEEGRLIGDGPVVLHYLIEGRQKAEQRVLPLRRLLYLFRHRRFSKALFPADPIVARGIQLLQVHDALGQGASHRDLAELIVGQHRTALEWRETSDSLRSRVRRMVHDARALALGGYRLMLHRHR